MPYMHSQRDLGLPPISAEVAFADEDADEEAQVTIGECEHSPSMPQVVSR